MGQDVLGPADISPGASRHTLADDIGMNAITAINPRRPSRLDDFMTARHPA